MKRTLPLLLLIFICNCACNQPFVFERPEPKPFDQLDRPIVMTVALREEQASAGKGDFYLFNKPDEFGGYYYAVYDWTSNSFFNKCFIDDATGFGATPVATYSERSRKYYLASFYPRTEIKVLDPTTGLFTASISMPQQGFMITDESAIDANGIMLYSHSGYELNGIRLTVVDTKSDSIIGTTFLEDGMDWGYDHDGAGHFYYFDTCRTNGYYDVNVLTLSDFSTSVLYSNPPTKPGAALIYYSGSLIFIENDGQPPGPPGTAYQNEPYLCIIKNSVLTKRTKIPLAYSYLAGTRSFIVDGVLYFIFSDSYIDPAEPSIRQALYLFNPVTEELELKGYFFDAVSNYVFTVRDKRMIYIFQENASRYRITQVDIDTLGLISRTTFSLY